MSDVLTLHIDRLESATIKRLKMRDLPKWVTSKTKILGRPYSFKDHEYQERIMADESREVVIRKCSQVGISEMSIRMALGLARLMPAYSSIYTFPTATFASKYVKTRVDPVISDSADLAAALAQDVDSSEVKKFGRYGFVYFGGASSTNAAISVMADHLFHDELSFSDEEVISNFQSRLTHSPFKRKTKLSTPTFFGDPIDTAFQSSKRWWNLCKCHHCGHTFVPDFYAHVRIPGFDDDIRKITKENLHTIDYASAVLLCPRCGKVPSLQPEHREWVLENPGENHLATGYQVQPFDAPNLISIPYLVESSTQYKRRVDFDNFALGRPAEDSDSGLQREDFDKIGIEMLESPFSTHVMGFDQGIIYRVFIAGVAEDGTLVIVHSEQVPVGKWKQRYYELCAQFRIPVKVGDAQPYLETILALQSSDQNLYGAFYVKKERLELYTTYTREESEAEGKTAMRQVLINRNAAFDLVMEEIRGRDGGKPGILIKKDECWGDVVTQCTDMRRVKMLNSENEFVHNWVKSSKKNDHFHNALVYLKIAQLLRGTAVGGFGGGPPGVYTFRLRGDTPAQQPYGALVRR